MKRGRGVETSKQEEEERKAEVARKLPPPPPPPPSPSKSCREKSREGVEVSTAHRRDKKSLFLASRVGKNWGSAQLS